jgi:hypothetical protein
MESENPGQTARAPVAVASVAVMSSSYDLLSPWARRISSVETEWILKKNLRAPCSSVFSPPNNATMFVSTHNASTCANDSGIIKDLLSRVRKVTLGDIQVDWPKSNKAFATTSGGTGRSPVFGKRLLDRSGVIVNCLPALPILADNGFQSLRHQGICLPWKSTKKRSLNASQLL